MLLKFSVRTYQGNSPHFPNEYTFGGTGGTIGRGGENDWVLQDPQSYLSTQHATIYFKEGRFYIVDNSTNGVFINGSRTQLGRGNQHKISSTDLIRVGEYDILVNQLDETENINNPFPLERDLVNSPVQDKQTFSFEQSESFNSSTHDPFDDVFNPQADDTPYRHQVDTSSEYENAFSFHSRAKDTPETEKETVQKNTQEIPQPQAIHSPTETPVKFVIPTQLDANKDTVKIDEEENIFAFNSDSVSSQDENNSSDPFGFFASTKEVVEEEKRQEPPEKISPSERSFLNTFSEHSPNKISSFIEPDTHESTVPANNKNLVSDVESDLDARQDKEIKDSEFVEEEMMSKVTHPTIQKPEDQMESIPIKETTETKKSNTELANNIHSNDVVLTQILVGAGLSPEEINIKASPEIFATIGEILSESLNGTINLLRSRTEAKNHLRLDKTIIGHKQNNPLKFLPNAKFVIKQTLAAGNQNDDTYLPLVEALGEAYDDISAHEYSIATSIQEALGITIKKHFLPENLQRKLEKNSPIAAKIPMHREAKLWKLFTSVYDNIAEEASESFQVLLDKEIATAYEMQITMLKRRRLQNKVNDKGNL